jgi:acyl carrier protein
MQPVTFQQVVDLLVDQNGILKPETVTAHSRLTEDLELDSLDKVELIMALEEKFDVNIDDDKADACVTVGDVWELLSTVQ